MNLPEIIFPSTTSSGYRSGEGELGKRRGGGDKRTRRGEKKRGREGK